MKICPFISHMLGEDNANTLTAESTPTQKKHASRGRKKDEEQDVVILGYDDHGWGGVQTEKASKTSTKKKISSHLFCLKDPCRFYRKTSGECMFDQMFSLIKEQNKESSKLKRKPELNEAKITKELEKVWQLQTKSVAEMISSIGEAEKNQKEMLESFKSELSDRFESLPTRDEVGDNETVELVMDNIDKLRRAIEDREDVTDSIDKLRRAIEDREDMTDSIDKLRNALEDREDVMENFSTTLSETVVNIEDNLDELEKKINQITEGLDKFKESEEELSRWKDGFKEKINRLADQQSRWEEYFASIREQQRELKDFFEQNKDLHNAEVERVREKEAKKHNNLGVSSFHNGAYEMAKEHFSRAVELDENSAEAYNNLGLSCTELGEAEEATEAFKKAIQLNPGLAAAYTNLGYVFYKQGSYEQAIEMYNEALGRSTDNSAAYTNLGNAYYKLEKFKEAREAWNKSVDLDPGNERAKRYLEQLSSDVK